MPIDISFLNQIFQPIFIIKPVLLVLLVLYIFFAFVIFKQVRSLNEIVKAGAASSIMELIAIADIFVAISLFIYTLVIL